MLSKVQFSAGIVNFKARETKSLATSPWMNNLMGDPILEKTDIPAVEVPSHPNKTNFLNELRAISGHQEEDPTIAAFNKLRRNGGSPAPRVSGVPVDLEALRRDAQVRLAEGAEGIAARAAGSLPTPPATEQKFSLSKLRRAVRDIDWFALFRVRNPK